MLTIFSTPKPFVGLNEISQWNAINSWKDLGAGYEIILLGNDKGVSNIAKELDLIHLPNINTNNLNTPLLDSVFEKAQFNSSYEYMMYINADIIICTNIIKKIKSLEYENFLMTGRRWDLDITKKINFSDVNWKKKLLSLKSSKGVLHNYSGKDYFIFKKGSIDMLPFSVGRPYWDDWFLYHARSKKYPIIDATLTINIIHQNHDYSHSKFGSKKRVKGPEYDDNVKLIKSFSNIVSLREADFLFSNNNLFKPVGLNRLFYFLSHFIIWRKMLAFKRFIMYYYTKLIVER